MTGLSTRSLSDLRPANRASSMAGICPASRLVMSQWLRTRYGHTIILGFGLVEAQRLPGMGRAAVLCGDGSSPQLAGGELAPAAFVHQVGKGGVDLANNPSAAGQLGRLIAHREDVFAAAIDDEARVFFLAMEGIGGDHRAVQRGLNLLQQLPPGRHFAAILGSDSLLIRASGNSVPEIRWQPSRDDFTVFVFFEG